MIIINRWHVYVDFENATISILWGTSEELSTSCGLRWPVVRDRTRSWKERFFLPIFANLFSFHLILSAIYCAFVREIKDNYCLILHVLKIITLFLSGLVELEKWCNVIFSGLELLGMIFKYLNNPLLFISLIFWWREYIIVSIDYKLFLLLALLLIIVYLLLLLLFSIFIFISIISYYYYYNYLLLL